METNRIRIKGATEYRYRYLLDTHILPELGGKRLCDITAGAVNQFLSEKSECGRRDGAGGLAASYVRSIYLVISSILKLAAEEGLCASLQSAIVKPPLINRERTLLTDDDRRKLECSLLLDTDGTKLGVLISLYTGLRVGEICALTWEDIDMEQQVLYVRHTVARNRESLVIDRPKTPSSLRCVPICSQLLHVLQKHFKATGYVISGDQNFLNPRTFEYRYHRLLENIGIPQVNYHVLRHTFATRCIESGVDVKSLSEILGHADVSTTLNTYVHSSMEQKRRQLERLVSQAC
ncbi:MAG: site-specific integrase [Oscillospiraceae bacterium]|nr:site-specific integrase [Oscillospiraceae bacterium]